MPGDCGGRLKKKKLMAISASSLSENYLSLSAPRAMHTLSS